ncbi:MAG: DNA-methyltransferase [Planctomycetota bacterium]|jgi:DNA modification methylase
MKASSKARRRKSRNKNWSRSYAVTWDDAEANPKLYEDFYRLAVAEAITANAAWYCWHASRRQAMVEEVWHKFGAFVHQQIIWAKDRPILTRSWYSWQHEPCFFGWVRPHQPHRVADDFLSSIWHIPTVGPGQRTDHPTSKPVEVFAIPMRQHTHRGDVCYEPFCGSGSQLIAAEQLGRRCYALEISPHYCDVIVRRWIHFVGEHNARADLVERYRLVAEQEVEA